MENSETRECLWNGSSNSSKDSGNKKHKPKEHARTEENGVTTVDNDELVLNQEGQPQTHRSTSQISRDCRETGLTQSSVVRVIHRYANLVSFRLAKRVFLIIVSFPYVCISQGSIATKFKCGGIFNNRYCKFSIVVSLKSVNMWEKYGQEFKACTFCPHRR